MYRYSTVQWKRALVVHGRSMQRICKRGQAVAERAVCKVAGRARRFRLPRNNTQTIQPVFSRSTQRALAGRLGRLRQQLQRDLSTLFEETTNNHRHIVWHIPSVGRAKSDGCFQENGPVITEIVCNFSNQLESGSYPAGRAITKLLTSLNLEEDHMSLFVRP